IRTEPVWSGGDLASVTRWVQFGSPIISVDTPMVVDYDGPGFHSGNCESFTQGVDWTLSRGRVHGVGSGEGDDQLTWEAVWATHQADGFLNRDGLSSHPGVKVSGDLGRLVRGERDAGKDMREPARATVVLEKMPALPRVGDNLWVDIEPTYSLPDGVERSMRTGEVTYNVDGHELRTANLLLA
ncbi:TPA: hypothetical protein OQU49_004448, partial [Shigella flexneri]|nr:hypothetical protein [Shigella flexneri]